MTLNVVALDTAQFKEKYLQHPNPAERLGFGAQMEAANQILKRCIDECQITRFTGNLTIPERPIFDGWAGALPDIADVKRCLEFLRELQTPSNTKSSNPWWVRQASFNGTLVDPVSVKTFVDTTHSCKFFEVLLANIVSGASVYEFIELGEFLELSAVNECGVLCWRQHAKAEEK